ncbi:MAG: LmeA family phospholipid-binding protein [Acidimicrobiales bacterium]
MLVGLLGVGDVTARGVAERELRTRLQQRVSQAATIEAHLSSFPFVGRLLVSGNISEVRVQASGVRVLPTLVFASIAVDAHDVHVDRNALFADRRVVLTGVGRGTVSAEIDSDQLSAAVGNRVSLQDHRVVVSVRGQRVPADVALRNGSLVLSVGGLPVLALRIPKVPLLPCVADAEVTSSRIRLTCHFDRVPPEMVGAAARAGTNT